MRETTIDINPYGCKLTIILDKDLKEVEKIYKEDVEGFSLDVFGAVTFTRKDKSRHYVSAFTDATHLSNIAHEIVHIKNCIYVDCAMNVDRFNDEPEAYLTGWLFDEIYKFLNQII